VQSGRELGPTSGWRHWLARLPKLLIAALLVLAILDMLAGVFLRYVVVKLTDAFDLPTVSFFWVEEVGEFTLAWLAALGAAVAIIERTHFALGFIAHLLPAAAAQALDRFNHVLIAGFGALAAAYGWKLCVLNWGLASPGLQINLAWLYASSVAAGALMVIYGLGVATGLLSKGKTEVRAGA
jgi:TRAP-type C4-dicarboxylate transport system permease small subunit